MSATSEQVVRGGTIHAVAWMRPQHARHFEGKSEANRCRQAGAAVGDEEAQDEMADVKI